MGVELNSVPQLGHLALILPSNNFKSSLLTRLLIGLRIFMIKVKPIEKTTITTPKIIVLIKRDKKFALK